MFYSLVVVLRQVIVYHLVSLVLSVIENRVLVLHYIDEYRNKEQLNVSENIQLIVGYPENFIWFYLKFLSKKCSIFTFSPLNILLT